MNPEANLHIHEHTNWWKVKSRSLKSGYSSAFYWRNGHLVVVAVVVGVNISHELCPITNNKVDLDNIFTMTICNAAKLK